MKRFAVLIKPASGHSGMGNQIRKFDTLEEAEQYATGTKINKDFSPSMVKSIEILGKEIGSRDWEHLFKVK